MVNLQTWRYLTLEWPTSGLNAKHQLGKAHGQKLLGSMSQDRLTQHLQERPEQRINGLLLPYATLKC